MTCEDKFIEHMMLWVVTGMVAAQCFSTTLHKFDVPWPVVLFSFLAVFESCWLEDSSHISGIRVLFKIHGVLRVNVFPWSFRSAVWDINFVQNGLRRMKSFESFQELKWELYPHAFVELMWLYYKMAPPVIAVFLSWMRLRVEQRISSLSFAERRETHRRRLEELLGWLLFVRSGFYVFLVKWLESYKSYTTALPGTWNVHVVSDACQESRLRIWYFLDRLFEVLGLQLKNERHNLCLWAIGSPHLVAMQMLCLLFGMLMLISSDCHSHRMLFPAHLISTISHKKNIFVATLWFSCRDIIVLSFNFNKYYMVIILSKRMPLSQFVDVFLIDCQLR